MSIKRPGKNHIWEAAPSEAAGIFDKEGTWPTVNFTTHPFHYDVTQTGDLAGMAEGDYQPLEAIGGVSQLLDQLCERIFSGKPWPADLLASRRAALCPSRPAGATAFRR